MMTKRLLLSAAAIWTVWQLGGCGPGPAQRPPMQILTSSETKSEASRRDASTQPAQSKNTDAHRTSSATEPQPAPPPPKPQPDPARITKENFDRLELGMSEEQVCDILGPPSSERILDEGKELTWQTGAKYISATFREGRLRVVDSRNLSSK